MIEGTVIGWVLSFASNDGTCGPIAFFNAIFIVATLAVVSKVWQDSVESFYSPVSAPNSPQAGGKRSKGRRRQPREEDLAHLRPANLPPPGPVTVEPVGTPYRLGSTSTQVVAAIIRILYAVEQIGAPVMPGDGSVADTVVQPEAQGKEGDVSTPVPVVESEEVAAEEVCEPKVEDMAVPPKAEEAEAEAEGERETEEVHVVEQLAPVSVSTIEAALHPQSQTVEERGGERETPSRIGMAPTHTPHVQASPGMDRDRPREPIRSVGPIATRDMADPVNDTPTLARAPSQSVLTRVSGQRKASPDIHQADIAEYQVQVVPVKGRRRRSRRGHSGERGRDREAGESRRSRRSATSSHKERERESLRDAVSPGAPERERESPVSEEERRREREREHRAQQERERASMERERKAHQQRQEELERERERQREQERVEAEKEKERQRERELKAEQKREAQMQRHMERLAAEAKAEEEERERQRAQERALEEAREREAEREREREQAEREKAEEVERLAEIEREKEREREREAARQPAALPVSTFPSLSHSSVVASPASPAKPDLSIEVPQQDREKETKKEGEKEESVARPSSVLAREGERERVVAKETSSSPTTGRRSQRLPPLASGSSPAVPPSPGGGSSFLPAAVSPSASGAMPLGGRRRSVSRSHSKGHGQDPERRPLGQRQRSEGGLAFGAISRRISESMDHSPVAAGLFSQQREGERARAPLAPGSATMQGQQRRDGHTMGRTSTSPGLPRSRSAHGSPSPTKTRERERERDQLERAVSPVAERAVSPGNNATPIETDVETPDATEAVPVEDAPAEAEAEAEADKEQEEREAAAKEEERREKAAVHQMHVSKELLSTERRYNEKMTILLDHYIGPLLDKVNAHQRILLHQQDMFIIKLTSDRMLARLDARLAEWEEGQKLGDIIIQFTPGSHVNVYTFLPVFVLLCMCTHLVHA
ncbi:hypothetical protein KIPB_004244 [Kipferlia bialata]|uniref:DH domain-containing protein n=1 Tax=Kipferlia bialata TaxID=797122 RepID=A0A9K3CVR1_9EUKA|nr:hypothetical protein KIPB_004244 [Kipferlia bialata]|eukprot:g4244.t1